MLSFSKSALCLLLASPLIAAVIAAGCSDTPNNEGSAGSGAGTAGGGAGEVGGSGGSTGGSGGGTAGAGGIGSGGAGGGTGGSGAWSGFDGGFVQASCINQIYLCGDTIDNDMDGLTDWQDPDCLGPCDNTEDGLNLGIPGGDGPDCTVDCYWDSNSGAGNDGCYWNHQCDPLSVAPNYYPEPWNGSKCQYNENANTPGTNLNCNELLNQQPPSCVNICPQLTPNGCDCFGCCLLYKDGKEYGPVWLGTEDGNGNFACNLDTLDDPKKCAPCTPVKNECYNGCGKCELCIGKDVNDLPPECFPSPPPDGGPPPPDAGTPDSGTPDSGVPPPPPPQCSDGLQPCGLPGQEPCPGGYYCITGCCILQPK